MSHGAECHVDITRKNRLFGHIEIGPRSVQRVTDMKSTIGKGKRWNNHVSWSRGASLIKIYRDRKPVH